VGGTLSHAQQGASGICGTPLSRSCQIKWSHYDPSCSEEFLCCSSLSLWQLLGYYRRAL